MNVFLTQTLYPDEFTPFLTHFHEFDAVFIGFLPLIQLEKNTGNSKSSFVETDYEKAVSELALIEKIAPYTKSFYVINEDYPTIDEIREKGHPIYWKKILNETPLADFKELNVALMSATGRLRQKLHREQLAEVIEKYLQINDLWYPEEGCFGYYVLRAIYQLLTQTNHQKIYAETEFYDEKILIDILQTPEYAFIEQIEHCKYIYTIDQSILFSISWDTFFFVIAIKEDKFTKSQIEAFFEGFWADNIQNHLWTWTKEEIDALPKNNN